MYTEKLDKIIKAMGSIDRDGLSERISRYILNNETYHKEIDKILEHKYGDDLMYSPKFALFHANLINFGFSKGTHSDFLSFCDHIKSIELYRLQQRVLFLSDLIYVDTNNYLYRQFADSLNKGETVAIVSYHYSNYKALVHYLLTLNIDLFVIAGKRQKADLEDEALDLAYMYKEINGYDSSITFITAEDKTSLVEIYQSMNEAGKRSKILLIYIDGNIGQFGHQIKNNSSYHFKGVKISMREGLNMLLAILKLPIFSVYIEEQNLCLEVKFLNSYSSKVKDIVLHLLCELESIVSTKDFFKWECLMYLHHWISNKDSLPIPQSNEDKTIRVLSLGEWFNFNTHDYLYVRDENNS